MFFIYINNFLLNNLNHLVDITDHGLLDIYIMHLFTLNFELYSALLATNIDFLLFR